MGKFHILLVFLMLLNVSFIFAVDYPVVDGRSINIVEGDQYISLNFHATSDTVFSIDKTGGINLGDKSSFYGTIWLVPAFLDKSNDQWYLCPLTHLQIAHSQTESTLITMDNPDETITCYQYSDTNKVQTQRMTVMSSYELRENGRIKITSRIRFNDILPKDTGFGFYFVSLEKAKFASVKSSIESLAKIGTLTQSATTVDMARIEKDLTVAKEVSFVSETGKEVGQTFDWSDMIDFGYKFSEVISLAGRIGLLLGTYGYGESDTITIDPLYTVDYSPIPAQHLQRGNVTASLDSQFASITDITAGVSDNNTGTTYETFVSSPSGTPNSTALTSPTADSGTFSTRGNAYDDGGGVATGSATDISTWYGYNFSIPSDSTITDVKVRLDAFRGVAATHYIACVNLTWNNGTTYTPCQNITTITSTEVAYNLSGLWGRTWTPADFNNANSFRVQVRVSTGTTGTLNLDWIPVTVTYTYPSANYSNGSAISGKWAVTYSPSYQYFLRVYKTTAGDATLTAYSYNSSTSINTQSTSSTLSGVGWFNINVTSLIQYMTSTLGLNYSAFRFYTNNTQSFSEERLRAETNDTTPPTINSCTTNTTSLGCGGTALLTCNVTDNIDVFEVSFTVDGTTYNTVHNGDLWQKSYSPIAGTGSSGVILDWTNTNALDLFLQASNYDPNIQINYTCCAPNWVAQYGLCETNDTMLKTYSDSNSCGSIAGLPIDNGTYVYCNYCSENLEKHYLDDCNLSGVGAFDWHDHNYLSCCVITELVSDCSILSSPYNATDYENCTATYHDFTLDFDVEQFFGFGIGGLASDKVSGKIWLNDTNNTYICISYVKTTNGQIVQTNPAYTKRTDATVALTQKEVEDREFFVTQNGLANIYWTDHNLVIDGREYVFGVECAGNNQRLISEKVSTVGYKPVNAPITRWFWAKDNIVPIVLGLLMVIIVVFLIFLIWRVGR